MLTDSILDIIFPKNCLSCQKEGSYLCQPCFDKIPVNSSTPCYICQKRSPDGRLCPACRKNHPAELTGLLIASDWNNMLVRQIIYECKYRFVKELAIPMAKIMTKFIVKNWELRIKNSVLIPIPLHKRRLSWRGFNQAELIAVQISKLNDIPILNNVIRRSRHTPPQMEIKNKVSRTDNVRDAFSVDRKSDITNKIVILVDDVCTTGSTFNECAAALWTLRPKEIWGLALARG